MHRIINLNVEQTIFKEDFFLSFELLLFIWFGRDPFVSAN